MRRNTLEDPETDPWASPDLHQGHHHPPAAARPEPRPAFSPLQSPAVNGYNERPTRSYQGHTEAHNGGGSPKGQQGSQSTLGSAGSGWHEGYGGSPGGDGFIPNQSGLGGGFGQGGDDQGDGRNRNSLSRALGGGRISAQGTDDVITIHMLPEKEGLFMFQHRNYEVKSARRGSSVIRRYSDFVWLVDCLHKRYPFRQIPLLPPKRLSGMFYEA
jgi:sorting nexin-8